MCRRKEVSKAKVTLVPFSDNRAGIIRRVLARDRICEYWHPPECQFYLTETGCKAGDKCLFPHHKVDEQPNKKPKKGYYSHKRRESNDKNAEAIVKMLPQLGCV